MKKKLPPRLQMIFDLARSEELWDICCDHGLLALHNLQVNKFKRVVCVDQSEHAIQVLRHKIDAIPNARESVNIICSDGAKLDWTKVQGTVVIAGVGDTPMFHILKSAPLKIRRRLSWILSPQRAVESVREGLRNLFPGSEPATFTVREGFRTRTIFTLEKHPEYPKIKTQPSPPTDALEEGRDYTVENGLWIFSREYLLRRGYCCDSGCRNCPYSFR